MLSTGPHFVEYLDFTVTAECNVLLKCKVRNIHSAVHTFLRMEHHKWVVFSPQIGNVKPETEIIWSKDNIEIAEDDEDAKKIEREDGELTFNIGKVGPLDRALCEESGAHE